MANKRWTEFATISTLTGSEIMAFVQGGVNKKGTLTDIANYLGLTLIASADTTAAPITINLQSYRFAFFTGSASISGIKTWAFTNATSGKTLKILFTLTGSFAQTFPSDVKMQNWVGDWDDGTKTWTPSGGAGAYEADLVYNGTNWLMKIYGPF